MSLSFTEKTTEELEARHRKEQKELAAKLMALKKSVSKGDKRKKKEVAAEIAVLESQLNERQEAESKQLKESNPASTEDASDNIASAATHAEVAEDIQAIGDSSSDTPAPIGGLYGAGVSNRHKTGGKKSKAKARQQRRAEEMKRMQEEAEKEAEGMVDIGQVETEAIEKLVSTDGLYVQQIRADGH
ncbi:OTU protein, partial [Dipsacomyces acuminosporus]